MPMQLQLDGGVSPRQIIYTQRDSIGAASALLSVGVLLLVLAQPAVEKKLTAAVQVTFLQLSEPEPVQQKQLTPSEPSTVKSPSAPVLTPPPMPSKLLSTADLSSQQALAVPSVPTAAADPAPRAAGGTVPAVLPSPSPVTEPYRPAVAPPAVRPTAVEAERYEVQILRYLESIKRYPSSREARQTRPAGMVTVWFDLSRAGRVLEAGIEKSSNSYLLDSEALKTVRTGSFPAFPESVFANSLKHRFSAYLSYELKTTE